MALQVLPPQAVRWPSSVPAVLWMEGVMSRPDGCCCDYGPNTEGPEEDCPHHGRPYSYWVERSDVLSMRIGLALEALAWDRPCDTRIDAARAALRGES